MSIIIIIIIYVGSHLLNIVLVQQLERKILADTFFKALTPNRKHEGKSSEGMAGYIVPYPIQHKD